jgi:flagellar hook-associated protein 2
MTNIPSIGFTAGGIDVNSIVSGLMSAERAPETAISNRQAAVKLQSSALTRLQTSLATLQSKAAALLSNGISAFSSTASANNVTATVGPGAAAGSLTFTVDALAAAHGVRTGNTVAASTSTITTAATIAISSTARPIGVTGLHAGTGVAAGSYSITVTQASTGATLRSGGVVPGSTTIGPGNDTIDLQIDGASRSIGLAAGTYTAAQLASAVQAGLDASGGGATASVDPDGRLAITTTHEGSTASLEITGGDAAAALGLSGNASGTDGAIQVGSGTPVTVTSAGPGATVDVSAGGGTLQLSLGGGLRAGVATVAVVSTGDRSLGAVASAINAANVGATAAAVKVSDSAWLMQLSATRPGVGNSLVLDDAAFSAVGGMLQTTAASDARITVGTGPGAYTVVSSSNTFTGVLPGVSLSVNSPSSTPTTVTVARDSAATADTVAGLVSAATSLLADIAMQTSYDPVAKKAAPLSTDTAVRNMAVQVRAAVTALVGASSPTLAGNVGITLNKNGTIDFDRAKFITALEKDPASVERLFVRGGTSTVGAAWAGATDNTVAGSYGVVVTTAATRATTGDVLIGGAPSAQTIAVRVGTTTATYRAEAGATAADIASGLNAALSKAGLAINVEQSGGGVRITAAAFGGAGAFDLNVDADGAGSWSTQTGTDVVGTIDGQAAIGVGNRLSLLDGDTSGARGLAVTVAEGASGAVGPIVYEPGIAARLVSLAAALTSANGALTTSGKTYAARIAGFQDQIDAFELRMTAKERQYRAQWTAVQTSLAALQNQQSWLASQLGQTTA